MTYSTYQDLNDAAMAHYQTGDFAQALALLDAEAGQFPASRREADYLRSCLAVRVGDVARTYQILDAYYAEGIWMDEALFRNSPSYAPLQGQEEFEKRVQAHVELRARTELTGPARLHLLAPSAPQTPTPLIFHLHGNGSQPALELPNWYFATKQGWLVAAPLSENTFFQGGNAFWPDHASAEKQLAAHLLTLKNEHTLDETRIILSGFSMGGDIAIAQALKGDLIPARGFLAIAPGGPMMDDPDSFRPLIEQAKGRVRGVILASSADPAINPEKIARVAQLLNAGGHPCRLVLYSDEGHIYPDDFPKQLKSALTFILRNA